MNLITGWHPFRSALIFCLPYLLVCEVLFYYYRSGSSSGFLIGGFLLAYLLLPSWTFFGRSAYYSIHEHVTPYLGCHTDSASYIAKQAFIEVQFEIAITGFALFLCIFLPTYFSYLLARLYIWYSKRAVSVIIKVQRNSKTKYHPYKTALSACLPYLIGCESLYFLHTSGFSLGFLFGGVLLGLLVFPSTLLFGLSYGYPIQEHSILYLGCEAGPTYSTHEGLILWQSEIFNNLAILFVCIYLTSYISYIFTNMINHSSDTPNDAP